MRARFESDAAQDTVAAKQSQMNQLLQELAATRKRADGLVCAPGFPSLSLFSLLQTSSVKQLQDAIKSGAIGDAEAIETTNGVKLAHVTNSLGRLSLELSLS